MRDDSRSGTLAFQRIPVCRAMAFPLVAAAMSAALLGAAVCAVPSRAGAPAAVEASEEAIPTDADDLFAYLQARTYAGLPAQESERHPSAGPHTRVGNDVRVFMNAALDASLREGAAEHPAGAGVVKEMFGKDGALVGWAVAVKTESKGRDGEGWYWYEVKSTTDNRRPVAAGTGVTLCSGCHAAGRDFVLSAYPLQ